METPCEDRFDPSIRRIVVVGPTGAGKSTLAGEIARQLHIPHIELDALYWLPHWTHVSHEEMAQRVDLATRAAAWVIDGNYSSVRDLVWSRAQAVAWLDYPLSLTLRRLWQRTWRRLLHREYLWETNYERAWAQFFSRNSIFLWALKTYHKTRILYPTLLANPENSHLKTYHFLSPRETEQWLDTFPNQPELF